MSEVYYKGVSAWSGDEGSWDLSERWADVDPVADLRSGDEVFDIGCAEGLVTFEVASRVKSVRAIELETDRLATAQRLVEVRGISNVTCEVGSISRINLEPRSFDVVLFLGVYHHLPEADRVPSLEKALRTARRQVLMRTPLQEPPRPDRLDDILGAMDRCGFDGYCFLLTGPRTGNVLVANRRGADIRPGQYPELVLGTTRSVRS